MKKLSLCLIVCFVCGCVSLETEPETPSAIFLSRERKLTQIDHVALGMTYAEVASLMSDKVVVGYGKKKDTEDVFEPVTIKNPYRLEIMERDGKEHKVVYYFTAIKLSDGMITEDELTPLVFDEDKLIGKGWDFLFRLKHNL